LSREIAQLLFSLGGLTLFYFLLKLLNHKQLDLLAIVQNKYVSPHYMRLFF
jgi:hypothetical protein